MTKPVNASPATTLVLSPASPPSQDFNTCPQRAQQPWHNPVYTRTPPPPCSSSRTHRQGHRRSSSRGCRPGRRHSSRYDCSPSRRRSPIRGRSLSRRRSLSRSCSPSRRRSSSRRYSNRSRSPSCWSSSSRGRRPTRRRFTSRSRSPSRRCSSGRIDSLSHRRPSKHTLSKTFRGSLDGTAPVSKRGQGDQPHATASQTTSRCTQAEADQGEQVRLPVESVERTLRTVVHAAGHAFTGYNVSDVRLSYRCSSYRSTKCKAKIHYIIKSNEYELCGEHSCTQKRKVTAPGLDVTEDMQEATDVMALTRMDLTAERIWKHIRQNFYPDELTLVQFGLTREQVIQRVHRTRRSHFGADLHGIVEVPPLSLVSGTNQPFFQFYRSYVNGSTLERLVGWAHPALMKLLKYKHTTLFLDGTFRCVPRPFYQCVVMMVYDNATDLFVPVFYTLCTSKTQNTYWHLMEAVNVAADDKIEPSMVVCDFETGLQAAALVRFPEADIVGCYFHFKQACRRKKKALGLPEREAKIAMEKGCLDMLGNQFNWSNLTVGHILKMRLVT